MEVLAAYASAMQLAVDAVVREVAALDLHINATECRLLAFGVETATMVSSAGEPMQVLAMLVYLGATVYAGS